MDGGSSDQVSNVSVEPFGSPIRLVGVGDSSFPFDPFTRKATLGFVVNKLSSVAWAEMLDGSCQLFLDQSEEGHHGL